MAAEIYPEEQTNSVSQAELAAFRELLNTARGLPTALRIDLAQAMLQSLSEDLPTAKPTADSTWMDYIRQRPSSGLPAPTDEEMAQWLDEYYTERYG